MSKIVQHTFHQVPSNASETQCAMNQYNRVWYSACNVDVMMRY